MKLHKQYNSNLNYIFISILLIAGLLILSGCGMQVDPNNLEQFDDDDADDDTLRDDNQPNNPPVPPVPPIPPTQPDDNDQNNTPSDPDNNTQPDTDDNTDPDPDCIDNDRDGTPVAGECLGNKRPDCDDDNPYIHTLRMCYLDEDHDGFGAGTEKVEVCVGVGVNNHNDLDVPYGELLINPGCSVPYYYRYYNVTQFPEYPYPYGEHIWHAGAQGYYKGEDQYSNYAAGWYTSEKWKYSENNRDCMPDDPKAHPWSPYFRETAREDGSFDYDCDGKLTKHYACHIRNSYGDIRRQWAGECREYIDILHTVDVCNEPYPDSQERHWYQTNGPYCVDGKMQKAWLCKSAETVDGESIECGEGFYMTAYHQYHNASDCKDERIEVLDTGLMWSRYLEANNLTLPQPASVWFEAEEKIRNGSMPMEYARYVQMCR